MASIGNKLTPLEPAPRKFEDVPTATNFLLMQTLSGFDSSYITEMLHTDVIAFVLLLMYQLLGQSESRYLGAVKSS